MSESTGRRAPAERAAAERIPVRRVAALAARALLVGGGIAMVVVGVLGALDAHLAVNPPYALGWGLAAIAVHDALLVPALAVIGLVLTRLIPAPYRAVMQAALIVSGSVALVSLPLWRGYGRKPDNPSVDPLAYERNLVIVLGVVWVIAAVVMLRRRLLVRRRAGAGDAAG
ncbi:hypothetical protein [Frankia sp. Cr2]|uniref:hypothetical protein n=1 Tax=Frankia sp. Cr2 TaxID=3073932 RepID=UPI002AD31C6D|nr:hypothetical protein [Frankia sp. Cr2]